MMMTKVSPTAQTSALCYTYIPPLHVHMYYLVRDAGARMHTVHSKQMKKINSKTQK